MEIFKAFTSLKQSRKLAEILPLESADMHYHYDVDKLESIPTITEEDNHFILFPQDVECWSLAALMAIIPYNVSFNKAVYKFKLVKFRDHWECYHENFGTVSTNIFKADNPIDACYEMILKLHELQIL